MCLGPGVIAHRKIQCARGMVKTRHQSDPVFFLFFSRSTERGKFVRTYIKIFKKLKKKGEERRERFEQYDVSGIPQIY